MKHKIILSGSKPVSLDQPKQAINNELNENFDRFYFGLVKVKDIKELNQDTIEITISRKVEFEHLQPGFVSFIDESIITGMNESVFVPYNKEQAIFPIIPIGGCYFSPDKEFIKLYKHLINICTGEVVKRLDIKASLSELVVMVEYDTQNNIPPKRYQQDITNLTAKFGDFYALKGQTIDLTLKEMSAICFRDNPKVSSYDGLRKYLKTTYDIDLNITSQKSK